ncbi:MAG TPA: hypothetical protein VJ946_05880, partial [Bacteroidales bacterium]|nr:hypothetical protein [Bacteroidales bacterium]
AMAWLETHVYDEEKGLFGRYHRCETPFSGSRGFGWDNAVGRPTNKYYATHEGDTIVFSYDIYMNNLNYSTYLMLAAMEYANNNDQKSAEYLAKANTLEKNINKWLKDKNSLPPYGDLLTNNGDLVQAGPYGLDETDYQWALSIPPFLPNKPEVLRNISNLLLQDMQEDPKGMFICAYNAILTSMDPLIHDEKQMMERLEYLVPQSVRAGKYLAMPYTIPELVDQEDGDPFHDVRPLVYSIAPWISAVTNFGLHRMPFGIALRGTQYLEKLINYTYKNALLDVNYTGEGELNEIKINGQKLAHSYQIPDEILQDGENKVTVVMAAQTAPENILAASTIRLKNITEVKNGVRFNIEAFGQNIMTFLNLEKNLEISDAKGEV